MRCVWLMGMMIAVGGCAGGTTWIGPQQRAINDERLRNETAHQIAMESVAIADAELGAAKASHAALRAELQAGGISTLSENPRVQALQQRVETLTANRDVAAARAARYEYKPTVSAQAEADSDTIWCTKENERKNWLLEAGGAVSLVGGGLAGGTAYLTNESGTPSSQSASDAKAGFGIASGVVTAIGGALVIWGAVVGQQQADHGCIPVAPKASADPPHPNPAPGGHP